MQRFILLLVLFDVYSDTYTSIWIAKVIYNAKDLPINVVLVILPNRAFRNPLNDLLRHEPDRYKGDLLIQCKTDRRYT